MVEFERLESDDERLSRIWKTVDAKIDRALRRRIRELRVEIEELWEGLSIDRRSD